MLLLIDNQTTFNELFIHQGSEVRAASEKPGSVAASSSSMKSAVSGSGSVAAESTTAASEATAPSSAKSKDSGKTMWRYCLLNYTIHSIAGFGTSYAPAY